MGQKRQVAKRVLGHLNHAHRSQRSYLLGGWLGALPAFGQEREATESEYAQGGGFGDGGSTIDYHTLDLESTAGSAELVKHLTRDENVAPIGGRDNQGQFRGG